MYLLPTDEDIAKLYYLIDPRSRFLFFCARGNK